MIRFILLNIAGLFLSCSLLAQDTVFLEKSPKQFSFTTGYRKDVSSNFDNQSSNGADLELEIAWKVSGFHRKSAVYFGVPLGYTHSFADSNNDLYSSTLFYGWIVRHEIGRDKKYTPFFGYGLLLNQLRMENTEGSIFGHQTRFEFGVNRLLSGKIFLFTKIEYSLARFPSLGNSKSNKIQFIGLKIGLRI
jgi:hypothetical protein